MASRQPVAEIKVHQWDRFLSSDCREPICSPPPFIDHKFGRGTKSKVIAGQFGIHLVLIRGRKNRNCKKSEYHSIAKANLTSRDFHSRVSHGSRRVLNKCKAVWEFITMCMAAPVDAVENVSDVRLSTQRGGAWKGDGEPCFDQVNSRRTHRSKNCKVVAKTASETVLVAESRVELTRGTVDCIARVKHCRIKFALIPVIDGFAHTVCDVHFEPVGREQVAGWSKAKLYARRIRSGLFDIAGQVARQQQRLT
jgi:hypothetical protein